MSKGAITFNPLFIELKVEDLSVLLSVMELSILFSSSFHVIVKKKLKCYMTFNPLFIELKWILFAQN